MDLFFNLLAGNSFISLAGSEEQINFSQQSPKMLKMALESFIHALFLFLGLFLKISRRVPLRLQSPATLNSDFHYEGNTELTEESSTTQKSQWSN